MTSSVFEHQAGIAARGDGRAMFGLSILRGLQIKHVYQGTVSPAEKARRRAKSKAAKAARKASR